jgi:hypothetical protein
VNALAALAGFARAPAVTPHAGCQLCAEAIDDGQHPHLVDLQLGTLLCACATCARLHADATAGGARFRAVPDRVLIDPGFALDAATGATLGIPVGLAFVFFNTRLGRWVALYPSPAGATEAALAQEPFAALAARTPLLRALAPDVEALLVYQRPGRAGEAFGASIEACYQLVAIVRRTWKGFHGGDESWARIEAFFSALRARAEAVS